MFRLRLFGGASIDGPEGPLTGRAVQRRRLALLSLLSVAGDRGLTRGRILAYLWPDADPERARHLLSDSVYRINQALDGAAIVATGDDLRLDPERLASDVWEFRQAIEREDWARAVELHAAPLLDGFFVPDSGEFDRWADGERERHRRDRARALEALARAAESDGDDAAAVRWWRALAADDPYSSRIALQLMGALERVGDRPAAVQHGRIHSVLVRDELGVEPDPEILRLEERLRTPEPATPPREAETPPEAGSSQGAVAPPGPIDSQEAAARRPTASDAGHAAKPSVAGGPPVRRGAPRRTWRRLALLAVVLVLGVVLASVWRAWRPIQGLGEEPVSIAVLPFEDLSPAGDQAYFADGITEELLVRLSKVEGLRVAGRTSSFAYRDRDVDVAEVAERLGVRMVLVGSVLKAENRLRIFAQLIDATNGYQVWSERYEREQEDVFAIQDDISRAIVTRLRGGLPLADVAGASSVPSGDPEAFNLYLRGRFEWHKRSEAGLRSAARYFEQATERAPGYARAFVGLGDAYAVLGFYDHLPPDEAFPRARESANRALEIAPSLAEAHATLGYVALYYDWDWERAEAEFRRSIELDPGYSTAHQWYANLLTALGRFDEAVLEMRKAQDLDPLSLIATTALGWVHYHAGDHERAIEQLGRALELDPSFALAHVWRGSSFEELGRPDRALAELERAIELTGDNTASVAALARAHAVAGDTAAARARLLEIEAIEAGGYVPSFEVAKVHEALGDRDEAMRWLERAYDERSHSMAFLAVDPQLNGLRDDPDFRRLVRRVGLEGVADGGG